MSSPATPAAQPAADPDLPPTHGELPPWGSAAAPLFGAWMGRMPGAPDHAAQMWIATGLIALIVLLLSFGGTIERMLEYFAWTMLAVVFGFLIFVNVVFVPVAHSWHTLLG